MNTELNDISILVSIWFVVSLILLTISSVKYIHNDLRLENVIQPSAISSLISSLILVLIHCQ